MAAKTNPSLSNKFNTKTTSTMSLSPKLPPQNIEAEQSLLGALLIDKDAVANVSEMLRPDNFYKTEQHGSIFSAIVTLYEKREPIDVVTVTEKLKQMGYLDKVGGPAYLTELVNMVPTAAHVETYAKIIREHSMRRTLISFSTKFTDMAFDEGVEVNDVLEECEQSIFGLSQQHVKRDFIQLKDAIAQSFDRLDELQKTSGKLRGVPTGYRDLDNKLAGLQDSNLIILAARPGMGKCLSYDSKIVNPDTGEVLTIQDYYYKQLQPILTLNIDLKIAKTNISHFVDDGQKEIFLVKTSTGREIKTTASHPFLTVDGWKKLYELNVGQKVATPREIPIFGQQELEDYKVKLIGYFLGDGGLTSACPRFTNTNSVVVEDFTSSVKNFPNIEIRKYDSNGSRAASYEIVKSKYIKAEISLPFSTRLKGLLQDSPLTQKNLALKLGVSSSSVSHWVNGEILPNSERVLLLANYFNQTKDYFVPSNFYGFQSKNSVTIWLQELSLMGKNAFEKEIPPIVYMLTKKKLALFLNRLFACDGCVYFLKKGPAISYCSVSKELIYGIQHLLLRFGIISKIRLKKVKYKNGLKEAYELEFRDSKDILIFCKEIGIFGKEEKITKALVWAKKNALQNNFTSDTLPIEVWNKIVSEKDDLSWRQVYQKMGLPLSHNIHAGKRSPKRSTVLKIAKAINSKELELLATSDIYWDKIVSIKSCGLQQVYDLTIPETHNFIANDFFVHNTSFALNLAQHAAVNLGIPVGIFSLEMSQEELVDRLLVAQADIDAWRLKTGKLDEKDYDKLSHAMGVLAEAPIFIDDTPGISLGEIRTKARRLQAEHGLKFIIVDYLQLIKGRGQENRVQEVSEISQGLKNLARELKVPVLSLSQLNRSVENRTGSKRPMLADLRESGAIEQDADVVMFIYREDSENMEAVKLDIQKHRNGSTGDIDLIFRGDRMKFYGMEKTRRAPAAVSKDATKPASAAA